MKTLLMSLLALAAPAFAAPIEVPDGYRALSLAVPSHQLRFLAEGDRVDVMTTFDAKMADGKTEAVTATILQNVIVRAVDADKGVVDLILNPNEAQYAALFDSQDKMWITRRGKDDKTMKPMEMASARKLFR